ncbi:ATP-binding protein [Paraliomyxa miuraensis]|uniref:ATP-binding protein n=1 Tax=Paraliomyxa miuraensis TaxID=376150 RepID=UPI002250F757|nr:sensor histidine kinase [Paraliomyxa miuraensis]MCX4242590.1 PAS domain-containing sensor histidine kinase [Paraliomyxa miuraensis]
MATDARILEAALEQAPGHIIVTDDDMTILYVNRVDHGYDRNKVIGSDYRHVLSPEQDRKVQAVLARARATGQPQQYETFVDPPSGERQWYLTQITAFQGQEGQSGGMIAILTEITRQRTAEQRVETLRKELLEASHRAGMAEIATGVLHNVGNVLNSVNVSSEALEHELEGSRLNLLERAVGLLDEHADDLPAFLSRDPRGSKLPTLLRKVSDELGAERDRLQNELTRLRRNLGLMRSIVEAQQNLAKLGVMVEPVRPIELIEQTLSMFQLDLENRVIELDTEIADLGLVVLDKQSVIQVLANLVRNSIEALEVVEGRRSLSVRLSASDDKLHFEVEDNGSGIDPEHLGKLFDHGFSTKPNGHGFGLHASLIAARTMNGSLDAHSEGSGKGARMCLTLPRIMP